MSGARIDVIVEVGCLHTVIRNGLLAEIFASWLAELEFLSVKGGHAYGSDNGRHEAVSRTAAADLLVDTDAYVIRRADTDVGKWFQHFSERYQASNEAGTSEYEKGKENEAILAHGYSHTLVLTSAGKRYFVSKKGYLGLGPGGTEPGDVVVILFGLDMPFVLRSADDG